MISPISRMQDGGRIITSVIYLWQEQELQEEYAPLGRRFDVGNSGRRGLRPLESVLLQSPYLHIFVLLIRKWMPLRQPPSFSKVALQIN